MNVIENKLWTHLSFENEARFYNKEIRSSEGLEVEDYQQLVKMIGRIAFHNPSMTLYYRGQSSDYRDKSGNSSLYPSIFRPSKGYMLPKPVLVKRFQALEEASELLKRNYHLIGKYKLHKFPEITWAILQHYEVCPTPLLDISASIHVAASFAWHNSGDDGHIFVLGIPHINGSMTYFTDEELLNIKLQSICPPNAVRPLFQDGHLVGTFPLNRHRNSSLNFARRVVAKLKFSKEGFWSDHFRPIPEEALYPKNDEVREMCGMIRKELEKRFNGKLPF